MCSSHEHDLTLSVEELQIILTALGVRASFVRRPEERRTTRALAAKLASHIELNGREAHEDAPVLETVPEAVSDPAPREVQRPVRRHVRGTIEVITKRPSSV